MASTNDSLKKEFDFLGNHYEIYFGILYSVVALPNFIVPYFGSFLNIKLGLRFMYIINGSFIMIGQFFVSLGVTYKSINTLIIGRFLFGLGYQTTVMCKNQMIIKWFLKSEVSLPMSITLCITDLSKFLCFLISPRVITFVNKF